MTWRRMFRLLAAIFVIALFPVLSVAIAYGIASVGDCTINEATVNPCVIAGIDFGYPATALGILGWLGLATLPAGAIALIVWLVVAAMLFVRDRRKP